jgi:hypothetical protein
MKRILTLTAIVLLTILALSAWAQTPPAAPPGAPPMTMQGPGPMMGGRQMASCPAIALGLPPGMLFEMRAEQLGLSSEQTGKLKTALMKAEEALSPLRNKAREAVASLRAGIFDPEAKNLQELADKAEQAEAVVIAAEVQAWTQVKEILTPDQLKTLQGMIGRGPGMGPMGPPPGATPPTGAPPAAK